MNNPGDNSKEGNSTMGGGIVSKSSILLCLDFISFKLGNSIQSDVLFGSSKGEITTYCSGKHFVLNEAAHEGAINVIRVTDQISPSGIVNIFTGGEDGFIKVWDASCRLLQSIDMRKSQEEEKKAADSGYWPMYTFNPDLAKDGKNPLTWQSQDPKMNFQDFLAGEIRYSTLQLQFPEIAKKLFAEAEEDAKARAAKFKKMSEM